MLNKYYKFNKETDQLVMSVSNTKRAIITFFEYLLAFLIVLNCNTIWNFRGGNVKIMHLTILSIVILVILGFNDMIKSRKNFKILMYVFMFVSVYNLGYALFSTINRQNFIIDFLVILVGLVLYNVSLINIGERYRLLLRIGNVIVILAAISLFFYIFGTTLNIIPPSQHILLEWGPSRYIPDYYHMYYETQSVYTGGMWITRNSGMFTEAPMYSFILTIGLIIEMFVRKNFSKRNVVILLIAIFTTISTTGIMVAGGLVFCKIIMLINKSKYRKILIRVGVPILIILAIIVGIYLIINKMHQGTTKTGSFYVRMDDFRVGFEAWMHSKFIGYGYEQYDFTRQYMNLVLRGSDIGGSSGIMALLPDGGIYMMITYFIPIIATIVYGVRKRQMKYIIVAIAFFILVLFTKIQYRYIVIYFLALGFGFFFNKVKSNEKKKEVKK